MSMTNPDCYFGDHEWRGGGCIGCGVRFRCVCGVYLKVENLDKHTDSCRWLQSKLERVTRP